MPVAHVMAKKRGFDIASLVDPDFHSSPTDYTTVHKRRKSSPTPEQNNNNNNESPLELEGLACRLAEGVSQSFGQSSSTHESSSSMFAGSAFRKVDKHQQQQQQQLQQQEACGLPSFVLSSLYHAVPAASRAMQPVFPQVLQSQQPQVAADSIMHSKQGNSGHQKVPASLLPFLPPSLAALSFPQTNWCAKCNATFRMTSDLVYHMRSHHKGQAGGDPVRKKRDEKLRCNICGETFRERHHLTRHMTSHQ